MSVNGTERKRGRELLQRAIAARQECDRAQLAMDQARAALALALKEADEADRQLRQWQEQNGAVPVYQGKAVLQTATGSVIAAVESLDDYTPAPVPPPPAPARKGGRS